MKKKLFLLFFSLLSFHFSFTQSWKDSYDTFLQQFQEQNFQKTIETGNRTLSLIGQKDTNYVGVLRYIAFSYYSIQDYDNAVKTYKETQELCKVLYGDTDYNYILVTYNLAINYTYIGKYSSAYPLIEEVLDFIIKGQGKESLDYINTANQLANIYSIAGSYRKAEEIYENVFEAVKSSYKETDSMYMATVNVIAPFYFSHSMYDKAEPYYSHAVEMMERSFGKLSGNYLASLNSLGEFYLKAGMYEKSEKVYLDFVKLCLDFYGKTSADYATALNNLAVTYENLGKNSLAEDVYRQSLSIKEKVYKKESDYYALTLSNLAVLYTNMGKYKEAEKLLDEAIEIYGKIYGDSNPNYSIALSNLASVYSSSGKYKEAIELTKKAMDIQRKNYGEKYDAYINSLNNLGLFYEQSGDYISAEREFEKASLLRKELQGENHADYAITLYNLANIKTAKGDLVEAERLLIRALEIQKAAVGEYHSSYANTLNSLAGLYSAIGNYRLAGETYEKCQQIFEKIYGDMHPEYGTFLNNSGLFYFESGDYEKSEKILLKSLEIQYNAFGKEHPDNVNMLCNLANTGMKMGKNREAEGYLSEAVRITKEKLGIDHPDYVSAILMLGVFYYETGNYDKTEKYYKEALEKYLKIYGENNSNYATALSNLGTLFLAKAIQTAEINEANDWTNTAIDYFSRAMKVDSLTVGLEHPDYATHNNNLAEAYRNSGQFDLAEPFYLKTIDIEKKVFGENYPDLAVTYHNLALLFTGASKMDKAEEYCLKSLELKQSVFGEDNPVCSETMSSLAYIYECMNNFEEAEKYYTLALWLNYERIKSNFSFLSEEEKSNYLETISHYNDMFISFAMKSKNSNPAIIGLVFNNELINKGILLRSSGEMKNAILNGKDRTLIEKYYRWIGVKQQLAKLYSMPAKNRCQNVEELIEQANILEKELVLKADGFNRGEEVFRRDWKEIRKNLKEAEAAIEFTHFKRLEKDNSYSDNYSALVILPGMKFPVLIPLFEAGEMEALIGDFGGNNLEYITKIYGTHKAKNQKLYNMIWRPLDSLLSGVNTIYYSPSGLLHKIAFSAIITNEKKYLSEKYSLYSLSSTYIITGKNRNVFLDNDMSLSVFGGAQFSAGKEGKEIWKYLEGTLEEANNVNKIFKENKISTKEYTGLQASEENLKLLNGENSPTVLHIATHGFFYPDPKKNIEEERKKSEVGDVVFRGGSSPGFESFVNNPNPLMRSGLALARANDVWSKTLNDGEDGVLTAFEVSDMNLKNSRLLVMSACETGLGDIKGSEGVYGLQRAFKMAGVKYIIMSLWQVPDKETEEFMIRFYKKLLLSKNIRKAFNETQAELRIIYDPYFWAAFVLIE